MPILDHFSPPLSVERVWNTFQHAWAATIARLLNRRLLPEHYFAAPNVQFGPRVEIDVGTFEQAAAPAGQVESVAVTLTTLPATAIIPAIFPDTVEVVIIHQEGGPPNSYRPVQRGEHGAIEMWLNPLRVGDQLPNLPLFLRGDLYIEVLLEETYMETCGDQRIAVA
jgi:hypothetical protein